MISGSIVALVTPMHEDGSVDMVTLTTLIEWHIAQGTDAIVAVGTTGESATLSMSEHGQIVEQVVQVVNKRIPVIAGTGGNSTTEALELTAAAAQAGADACLLVTPYYNKPSQRGLFEHFKVIAESVEIPQILYNVPSRTACDMLPETIEKLSHLDNIIGVKEATGDLARGKEVMDLCAEDFIVYSGDDATALELILLGAKGNISVTANVVPAQMHQMCALALEGKADEARAINEKIKNLHRDLFLESNPVPVKWAMQEMKMISAGIRLPLVELDIEFQETLRSTMKEASVL